jgi:hypothetical protein
VRETCHAASLIWIVERGRRERVILFALVAPLPACADEAIEKERCFLLRRTSPEVALLRHANLIEQCPFSGVIRKRFAHTEFFSV